MRHIGDAIEKIGIIELIIGIQGIEAYPERAGALIAHECGGFAVIITKAGLDPAKKSEIPVISAVE